MPAQISHQLVTNGIRMIAKPHAHIFTTIQWSTVSLGLIHQLTRLPHLLRKDQENQHRPHHLPLHAAICRDDEARDTNSSILSLNLSPHGTSGTYSTNTIRPQYRSSRHMAKTAIEPRGTILWSKKVHKRRTIKGTFC